jgi:hypothetical protein
MRPSSQVISYVKVKLKANVPGIASISNDPVMKTEEISETLDFSSTLIWLGQAVA